jgi:hypothetical protein
MSSKRYWLYSILLFICLSSNAEIIEIKANGFILHEYGDVGGFPDIFDINDQVKTHLVADTNSLLFQEIGNESASFYLSNLSISLFFEYMQITTDLPYRIDLMKDENRIIFDSGFSSIELNNSGLDYRGVILPLFWLTSPLTLTMDDVINNDISNIIDGRIVVDGYKDNIWHRIEIQPLDIKYSVYPDEQGYANTQAISVNAPNYLSILLLAIVFIYINRLKILKLL